MLSVNQVNELLDILDRHNIMFISKSLGPQYLTEQEKAKLVKAGIDPLRNYNPAKDTMLTSFYFGLISDAIGDEAKQVTFEQLKTSLMKGQYMPLTYKEKATVHSVKMQYLGDIKANKGRIFQDLNNIISEKDKGNREAYEKVIRDELVHGIENKHTAAQIASALGHKTGDWSRNFGRIVEYTSHQAFDEGRVALYERKNGADGLIYKQPYDGACKYCISLYLTNGVGSKPKIFKISELRGNGTNIGRKAIDWKPIIGSTHPFCRCTSHEYDSDYDWDEKTGGFTKPKEPQDRKRRIERPKVNVSFNGKEYKV